MIASNLEKEFFSFIYQRQLIWYKRFVLKEDKPWTEDPVLATYKIINVYRELDKCTIYLIDKLKEIKDRKAILLNCIFYRFFNQYQLYEKIGFEPFKKIDKETKNKINESLTKIKSEGKPIFNNAYLISSSAKNSVKHVEILNNLEKLDLSTLVNYIDQAKTPEEALATIQKVPMVGPFLACEVWTDLSYFKFFKQGWTDNDFVNIGPGAEWGLEILYYQKLSKEKQKEMLIHLHTIQREYLGKMKQTPTWQTMAYKEAYSNVPFLSITNIEGALCEFRKYWNISHGRGRRKYFYPVTGPID